VNRIEQLPPLSGLIDLHSHTNESDGSFSPEQLIATAAAVGLDALAITDHDTFAGYEKALPFAQQSGLDLVRGIELNSRLELKQRTRYVHVLGYFPFGDPLPAFGEWLSGQREDRRNRNRRLAENLQRKGVDVTLEEVEARGKSLAGRPHFARVLVEKGYAADADDAFEKYIGEDAPTFVERQSQTSEEVIQLVRAGGGVPVIAHPIRLGLSHDEAEREVLLRLKDAGLLGLEVYHSEHPADLQRYYARLAGELDLLPTGGSDFHGAPKPDIGLGTGRRYNVQVPRAFLDRMRTLEFPALTQ
jgi:3',5'-nucleoside bisphosphate phosphatase